MNLTSGVWALGCVAVSALLIFGCGGGGGGSSSSSPTIDQTQTLSNLKQLGIGLLQYEQDWDEKFPIGRTTQALEPVLIPYTRSSTVFVDPNTNIPFEYNVSLAGMSLSSYIGIASNTATFYDLNPPVPDSRPIALLSGTSELISDAQWQQLATSSGITIQ